VRLLREPVRIVRVVVPNDALFAQAHDRHPAHEQVGISWEGIPELRGCIDERDATPDLLPRHRRQSFDAVIPQVAEIHSQRITR
jgi:hypothetical protein